MECSRVNQLFSEYIDDAIDEKTRRTLEEHLTACESCAGDLKALRSSVAAFGSLVQVRAPADFIEKLHARIELNEQVSWVGWLKTKLFFPLHIKLPLEVAGLAMAALLVVVIHHGAKQEARRDYAPSQVKAPKAEVFDLDKEMRSQKQLALKSEPPPQPSEAGLGAAAPTLAQIPDPVPAPGSAPVPAPTRAPVEEVRPIQLALLLGQAKGSSTALAERDDRLGGGDQPAEVHGRTSAFKSSRGAASPSPPAPKVRPAAPSAAARSAPPSQSKAAGTLPGKEAVEESRSAFEENSARSSARARESKPSADRAKMLDDRVIREPADPVMALAEIRGCVENLGGVIVSIKHNDLTSRPESLLVRIPGQSFPRFLDQLHRIGPIRDSAGARALTRGSETVAVQITLELAN
jgi:anti-sigma factor RsiW